MNELSPGVLSAIIVAGVLLILFILEFLRCYKYAARNKSVLKSNKIKINQELDQVIDAKLAKCVLPTNRNKMKITALLEYIIRQFRDLKELNAEWKEAFEVLRKHIVILKMKTIIAGFHEELKEGYIDRISVDEYEAFNVLKAAGATRDNMTKEFANTIPINALERHFLYLYENIMSATFEDDESRDYVILVFYKVYMSFERYKKSVDEIVRGLSCDRVICQSALDPSSVSR